MKDAIYALLIPVIKQALKDLNLDQLPDRDLSLAPPKDSRFGDLSINVALRLGSLIKKSPLKLAVDIAGAIKKHLQNCPADDYIKEIKVENSGFINFYLNNNYFYTQLKNIITEGSNFAKVNLGKNKRVLIEFVSANPTGPLSVAHARQAAVGMSLSNILDYLGFKAKREYYLNDEGNQINILGRSIELRVKELSGEKIEFPDDHYQGDYIYEIAKKIKNQKSPDKKVGIPTISREKIKNFQEFGVKYILDIIKKELSDFGVRFDYWYSQKKLRKSGKIRKALDFLKKKDFLYEQDGALWFKSAKLGDDKDRVVVKSDGTYTYLAPDIAYHRDKFKRGFNWLINLWGPDHHGYINRLKAAIKALGRDCDSLSIIIVQLASIFREGKPAQMSTRKGQYITLREVLDEVGLDAARFFFLMRRTSSHLDFDLSIAKKQTPENPVYYIQYAHARICSILRNSPLELKCDDAEFKLLKEQEEIALIKKLWQFSLILNICFNTLDPYMLTVFLQDVAECFHKFYDAHRVLSEDERKTLARLLLIEGTRIVLCLGLDLLGVSKPEKM